MGRILFFLAEASRALRRSASPSFAAVVTVAVTVLLLGVLIPVLSATESKATDVRDEIALRVFLFDQASDREISKLERQIEGLPHVESVDFVSKAEARRILRQNLEDPDVFEEVRGNPLPASFDVTLDDADNLEAVQSALQPPDPEGNPQPISPAIDEVSSAEESEAIREVTTGLKILLFAITVMLLAASLLLIGNTIRLSIYARRREVEVMRLVGATNSFIRWPFVIEGIVVGFLGAAIAVGILWAGKVTIADPLSDNFAFVDNLQTTDFAPLIAALVAAAMAVSALGSAFTLRRYLRV